MPLIFGNSLLDPPYKADTYTSDRSPPAARLHAAKSRPLAARPVVVLPGVASQRCQTSMCIHR